MHNFFEELGSKLDAMQCQLDLIQKQLLKPFATTPPEDDIIGVDEACKLTRNTRANMYVLTSKKKIPHMKQGKWLYFSRKELMAWIRKGKQKTVTEIQQETDSFLSGIRIK